MDRKEAEAYQRLDPARLPRHIAIIMDGNGRWARRRHMPRVAGHRAGVAAVRSTVETAARIGIPALTLYAFSEENWRKRPRTEVDFLMRLLCRFLKAEIKTLNEQQHSPRIHRTKARTARVGAAGDGVCAPGHQQEWRDGADAGTKLQRPQRDRRRVSLPGRSGSEQRRLAIIWKSTEQLVSEHLYTRGLPDPDLVVRTSGEMRLSNFLLWQLAYSEIYVTQTLWPDFRGVHLLEGIEEFQKRERRYGGLGRQDHEHAPVRTHSEAQALIKRIVTAVVLIPLVLLLVLNAPLLRDGDRVRRQWRCWQSPNSSNWPTHYRVQPLWRPTYAYVVLFFLFVIAASANRVPLVETTSMIYGLALAAALAPFVFLTHRHATGPTCAPDIPAAAASSFAFAYIAIPMALAGADPAATSGRDSGDLHLLVVWAGDIFAYFVGKAIGRHRMSPEISPNKTWEGAVASVVASVAIGTLWFQHAAAISTWLLQAGLIERRDGMFGLQQPSTSRDRRVIGSREYRRATGRSRGVADQTWRRRKGFRLHPARPWRHARPHRRHAVRGASGLGMERLAT